MKTLSKTLEKVGMLYSENLNKHGLDSKSVGWKDKESQILRFVNLAKVIASDEHKEPLKILDYGCGYGAMYEYFVESGTNIEKYCGYDISSEMLTETAKRVPSNVLVSRLSSEINDEVDFSFVSGTFNVMFDSTPDEWDKFIKETITRLFEVSQKGIAFNLLTSYVDWKAPNLYYADPLKYFDFCKTNLSKYVTLVHDYKLYEWTILVRK